MAIAEPVEHVRRDGPDAESVLESEFGLTRVTTGKTLTKLASSLVSAQSSMLTRSEGTITRETSLHLCSLSSCTHSSENAAYSISLLMCVRIVISALSVFKTAAPASVVVSVAVSNFEYITPTAQPTWFSKLPKDVKTVILSEQSVLNSIVTKVLKISSSGPAAPAATVGIMGAVAAGALGVVAAL